MVVSPRPYRLGQRKAAAEETRVRIVGAARELLVAEGGFSGFTVEAVARGAGVARMTVYYQFGSKAGLLEAIYDDLAARGKIGERLADAFRKTDPLEALSGFVEAFGRFYASDRHVIRRLQGLAALDPDFERGARARGERRREGLRVLLPRLQERYGRPVPEELEGAVDVLHVLTSFETFDGLAGNKHELEKVAPVVERLVRAVLDLDGR